MNKFSILNLSDLHLDNKDQEFQSRILSEFAEELNKLLKKGDHIKWKPEYIVLPGDIINKGDTDNYDNAKNILLDFCEKIDVPPQHMIMVPGNHDKKKGSIKTISQYQELIKKFDDFSKLGPTVRQGEKVLDTFLSNHEKEFVDFNNFHSNIAFNQNEDFDYFSFPPFQGTKLEHVTGIKIFHKNKVCFLNLNTEWLYAENDLKKEAEKDKFPAKREFRVGKNIARELHSKIMLKCPDYTIITLMHQNPYNLSWFEMNPIDLTGMYTFNFIESCSDIIFSGHDHAVKTDIPDLIKNRVQHFRIGTPCWTTEKGGQDFPYSTSIICVDDITNSIELLTCSYNQISVHQEPSWKFNDNCVLTFDLRNKYEKRNWEKPDIKRQFGQTTNLRVRNFDPSTIESKIYDYFMYDASTTDINILVQKIDVGKLHIANETEENRLTVFGSDVLSKLKESGDKLTHLILYYEISSRDHPEDSLISSYAKKHEKDILIEQLNKFRLAGQLVVNIVSVEMPGKFLDSENKMK